jgi:hypothetical protein
MPASRVLAVSPIEQVERHGDPRKVTGSLQRSPLHDAEKPRRTDFKSRFPAKLMDPLMAQQVCVVLSAEEREQLAAVTADRNRPRKHVERARIVLASADRHSAQRVAQSIGVSRPTVWRWQQRFAEAGVAGLLRDKTRKPGKALIAAETTARVVALTP